MIVIGICLKNGAKTIHRAISSIFNQRNIKGDFRVLIANDNSKDNWQDEISDYLKDKKLIIQNVDFGKPYLVRNFINEYIKNNFDKNTYIGRLDCDDEIIEDVTLSKIEEILSKDSPDALMLGNKLRLDGEILDIVNIADKNLLDKGFLLDKLYKMSLGNPEGELPSCNTFIKASVDLNYRNVLSAEDHWFTVDLLLNSDKYDILICPDVLYTIYSLSGEITRNNKRNLNYIQSRIDLFNYVKEYYNITREKVANNLLNKYNTNTYHYLGEGFAGIVYHDNINSYKIHIPKMLGSIAHYRQHCVSSLIDKKHLFENTKHFFRIKDVLKIDNTYILISEYQPSEIVNYLYEDEMISFLTECWQKKIILVDIKEQNFVRVNGLLKMIDIEIDNYTDNLFLNMIVRSFIRLKYQNFSKDFVFKLGRSAINNFDLPELEGVKEFANKVFANIIYDNSSNLIETFENNNITGDCEKINFDVNLKDAFFQNILSNKYISNIEISEIELNNKLFFEPKNIVLKISDINTDILEVTLLIKTCPQDSEVIIPLIEHIVKQLSFPDKFFEKVIAIDIKHGDYIRQYSENYSLELLLKNIEYLIDRNIIDRYIILPEKEIENTNYDFFGIKTNKTHTYLGVPVTPQLYAINSCKTDLVLQLDCDAMISRYDYNHSFLNDMINELNKNKKVVSVGFNICQSPDSDYKPYSGFENGGYVPEVRFCLLSKNRLNQLKPLPNKILEKGFELSWYRSVEIKQREIGYCSIRGGSPYSFYIHPQNYRKTNTDVWMTILDRIESGNIINKQFNEFDLNGSYYEWCVPKRNEKIVIVSCLRNIEYSRFLRFWYSIISQTYKNWGMILIDDNSDNGLDLFIDNIVRPHKNHVTYIKNRIRQGVAANTYKAIHYFTENPESIIAIIDGDDALLGNDVLQDIVNRYEHMNSDVVIGKMYRTDKFTAFYKYTPNFLNPRLYGGNVWQHLRTFKKYLFDSLSIYDLKLKENNSNEINTQLKLKSENKWIEYCVDYAYMIPIVEMSKNPQIIDRFNYFHDRSTLNTAELRDKKDQIISKILAKAIKSEKDIINSRKTFIPNQNRIEIDITYYCNLKCFGCNRSCEQAPSNEIISINQILNFIEESIKINRNWEVINILGGEPTTHPNFNEIIRTILYQYIDKFSPSTVLQITSNGLSKALQKINELPNHKNLFIDRLSFKTSNKVEYFSPFNDAPVDNSKFINADFSKGCWVTSYCGIGLNPYGYYACSVIGGIDRVVGKNIGIKSLLKLNEINLKEQLSEFCKLCGNFSDYDINKGDFIPRCEKAPYKNSIISRTWLKIYKDYEKKQMDLSKIYE